MIKAITAAVLPPKLKQIVADRQAAKVSNLSYFVNGTTEVVWVPSEKSLFVGSDAKEYKGETIEAALTAAQLR
jgi:hypothetical protein